MPITQPGRRCGLDKRKRLGVKVKTSGVDLEEGF